MCTALHSDSVDGWETFGDIFLPSYETGLIAFLKRIFIFSKKTKLLGKSCNEECLSLWLCEWLSNEQSNIHLHSKEEKGGRRDNKLIFYFNPCFTSFSWIFHFQWSDKAGMRCHCLRLQPPQHIMIFSQELLNVKRKTELVCLFLCKSDFFSFSSFLCWITVSYLISSCETLLAGQGGLYWQRWPEESGPKSTLCHCWRKSSDICFVFWLHHWFSGWQYLINSIPLSRATSLGDPMARGPGATIPRRLLIIICKKRTQQYFFSRQNIIVFESTELELEWPKECLIVPRKMREVPLFSAQCGHHSASCQMEFHLNESWRRSSYFGKWKEKSKQHRV